ncbi:zinc ribbon domain-containing protein [Acidobacteriota bacterium]
MDIDFDNLIKLQNLDEEIRKTSVILEKIPTQLKDIDKNIENQFHIVDKAKEKLAQNQKKRRTLEAEVQDIKSQIGKYKHQQTGVKTNKEYSALIKEIDEAQRRIDAKEEEIISEMLGADEIGEEIQLATTKANKAKEKLTQDKATLNAKNKELEEEKTRLLQGRDEIIPLIPKDQFNLYKKTFKKMSGVVMSPVTGDFCSMCQIRIRPQVLNELIAASQIILCENCGRILYWSKKGS